jgi:NADH-quinone oxidoreductase subunit N
MNWYSALPVGLKAATLLALAALVLLAAGAALLRRRSLARAIGIAGCVLAALPATSGQEGALAVLVSCALAVIALLLLPTAELEVGEHALDSAALVLLGTAGGIVLATSTHLLALVLGLETLSLSLAVLCGLGRGERPVEAAFKFFVLAAVSLATVVYGIGLHAYSTGSFDLGAAPGVETLLYQAATALIVLGLLFELAIVPLHFGALGTYMAAPTAFAGFAMTAGKLAAGIALMRVASHLDATVAMPILIVGGTASILWATFAGMAQRDLRGMLAYSAVAHAGFVALALGCGPEGHTAAMFYLVVYVASSSLAFAALADRGTDPISYASLRERPLSPWRSLALGLALLSLAGVPPGPGLWAKVAVLMPAWHQAGPLVTSLAALGGVFGALYYLRPLPDLLAGIRARTGETATPSVRLAIAFAALALVVFTVVPWLGTQLAQAGMR